MNFATPFRLFKWLQGQYPYGTLDEEGEQQEDGSPTPPEAEDEKETLRIHATVGGHFKPMAQKISMVNENTGKEESQIVGRPFSVCMGFAE